MKEIAPLAISVKPSRHLWVIQSAAHLAAAAAVLASSLPSWLAAMLLLLVGASLARMRRMSPLERLLLRGDGQLEVVGADGAASVARVHPHTLVLPFLVVLVYRQEGRVRSLTMLGDSLAPEDFRQLRLWLRWYSIGANPADNPANQV